MCNSPETDQIREAIRAELPAAANTVSLTGLAEDLVECGNLDVLSLRSRLGGDTPSGDLHTFYEENLHRFHENGWLIGSPHVSEVEMELAVACNNEERRFWNPRTVDVRLHADAASYWLERFFYNSTRLSTVSLRIRDPSTSSPWLDPERVVPKLTRFELLASVLTAEDLLAMLAASKESLTELRLRGLTFVGQSTWRNVLPIIARDFRNPVSLSIARLYEDEMGYMAIDFPGMKTCVPEEYRPGLELLEKGHVYNRRMASTDYKGSHAGKILEHLALCMAAGTPDDSSEERCSCPRHREYTSF